MAYTSDTRMKNLLKDIHLKVLGKIEQSSFDIKVGLRIHSESSYDSATWERGGLTFTDPVSNYEFGSNDCAWYVSKNGKKIPLVVVEGTYGTERGQFGDGQFNRFSHIIGVAKNGYTGVMFVPFDGESYSKLEPKDSICTIKSCTVRKKIIKSAINVSKKEPGRYFVMDSYEPEILVDLIFNEVLNYYGLENNLSFIYHTIYQKMHNRLEGFKERNGQMTSRAFLADGTLIDGNLRFFTHNYESLTTSQKRDGHGLFGKILSDTYSSEKELICLFIRLNDNEILKLKQRKSKELKYIFLNYKIITIDGLAFSNTAEDIKNELLEIKDNNLHDKTEKPLLTKFKVALENGEITISNVLDQMKKFHIP